MKKICIEEKWWSDPRRNKLADLLRQKKSEVGPESTALELWIIARNYYKNNELIPMHMLRTLTHWRELIDAHLVTEEGCSEGYVYARGSHDLYAPGGTADESWNLDVVRRRHNAGITPPIGRKSADQCHKSGEICRGGGL